MSNADVMPPVANRTPRHATQTVKVHASLNVSDLPRSLAFYAALFGVEPVKAYPDYAKFEIDNPPLVLSLKPQRACAGGPLNHLGLRVTSIDELEAIHCRLKQAGARIGAQDDVACCYARQSKLWITDPDETLWEVYVFHEDVPDWGEKRNLPKLWSAPLKAFGIRGVVRRWWANAYGPRRRRGETLRDVQYQEATPIPEEACPTAGRPVDPHHGLCSEPAG